MALPIEATPELDIDSWVHLCERMEYLAAHPHPARVPVIDKEALKRAFKAMDIRQARMEAERNSNSTSTLNKEK